MTLGSLLREFAVATLVTCLLTAGAAAWSQPGGTQSVETVACNREDPSDNDAHGLVCLKLHCFGGSEFRFTIIADAEFFGSTRFSSGPVSITLNMEPLRSEDPDMKGWSVSFARVRVDFLQRMARENDLQILNICDGCKIVPIVHENFAAELARVAASCKVARLSTREPAG